jgi:hypothetical protein
MWLDLRKGGTWSRTENLRFCYHFEADNERSTIEFESSHYLNWLWSYCWLKMYMPVHFVWTMKTLQAYISIQYYARSAPFYHILTHIVWILFLTAGESGLEDVCIRFLVPMFFLWRLCHSTSWHYTMNTGWHVHFLSKWYFMMNM